MADILVNPEEIRRCGQLYCEEADEWLGALPAFRYVNTGAFGSDPIGVMIRRFHAATHERTLTYLTEIGECADDVGQALIATARAYEEVEATSVQASIDVLREVAHVGPF